LAELIEGRKSDIGTSGDTAHSKIEAISEIVTCSMYNFFYLVVKGMISEQNSVTSDQNYWQEQLCCVGHIGDVLTHLEANCHVVNHSCLH
jgi:hypothetical protein